MRCKTCHYSLTGLAEHRCPECGCAFDPADPTTFITDGALNHVPRVKEWEFFGSVGLLFVMTVIALMVHFIYLDGGIAEAIVAAMIVSPIVIPSAWFVAHVAVRRR